MQDEPNFIKKYMLAILGIGLLVLIVAIILIVQRC
jgi:hypothetical protein